MKSDFERGPFTEAEKVGLRCADRLHHSANQIDDDFYAKLQSVYNDQQIIELIATASAFQFFSTFRRRASHPAYSTTRKNLRWAGLNAPTGFTNVGDEREGALSVFARAKELEKQGRSIIHLELGEPDFHPAASVNEALNRAVREGKDRYCPVIGVPALQQALAEYLRKTRNLNVSPDNVVIAPGCKIALLWP